MKKYLAIGGGVLLMAAVIFFWALFTRHLPVDRDGYSYEYIGGQIMKVKDFVPPPGTRLMQKKVGDHIVNYYGTSTGQ